MPNLVRHPRLSARKEMLTFVSMTMLIHVMLFCLSATAQAPDWLWARGMNGDSTCTPSSIAIDTALNGDIYTAGWFFGTVDFNPGAGVFNLTSVGARDIFISKLNASGNFVWARRMSGINYEEVTSIAIDPSGNGDVYTTGYFEGTVDFDPGAGVFNLTAVSQNDIFISKLNSLGNFIWAKQIGGFSNQNSRSIALDPSESGYIYTTGVFGGMTDFDPGAGVFNLTSLTTHDLFVSKLDSAGNFVWAKAMGGATFTDYARGSSISIDPAGSGNVYTTGSFFGTIDFDPGAGVFNLTSTVTTTHDIFISKLDSAGNFIWAKQMGGTGHDSPYSIAIDPFGSGNVYTTGWFLGTADFDPGAGIFNLISDGDYDIFISKLNASGNFVWAKRIGGINSELAYSLILDPSGSGGVYTTGYFIETVDFDPGPGTFNLTTAIGTNGMFILKLDSSGNFMWAKDTGGSGGTVGLAAALDAFGKVHVAGTFGGSASFGSTILTGSALLSDFFIAKLDNLITGINPISIFHFPISISTNPFTTQATITFTNQLHSATFRLYNLYGQLVQEKNNISGREIILSRENLGSGVYVYEVSDKEKKICTGKAVVY